ncbi:MAG: GTPase Era [Gemmatimonadetes bacterium]|nr:GTPase Era [Gemmatimonadota bacterium]
MEGQLSQEATTRAGYVALVGLPNAGKSTLLNALAGEHLSIVTAKAQTTWQRVAAIRTEGAVQMILLDTPGVVTTRQLFHRSMLAEAMGSLREADVAVAVVDGAARNPSPDLGALFESLKTAGCPATVAVNKADHPRFNPRPARRLAESAGLPWHPLSALAGGGLDALLAFVRTNLPASPFLYPEDEIAAAPTRFFVQELIRETVFEQFHQEIPYSVAVRVEEFREGENPVYVAATLFVERKSQKGILVGKGGTGIRALGGASRRKIEHLLEERVYLDLWVKVWDGWRRKREGLMTFGYRVPDEIA